MELIDEIARINYKYKPEERYKEEVFIKKYAIEIEEPKEEEKELANG